MSLKFIDGFPYQEHTPAKPTKKQLMNRALKLQQQYAKRRSIREFSNRPVSAQVIEQLITIAGTAPSGANKQPWSFCAVQNPQLKKQIRIAAEEEEKKSYENRMNSEWLADLAPLGTDWSKPFLETAPWLIIVFKKSYELGANNKKKQVYYPTESVGIACGFLISAIHSVGLCTLTHTPSPMNFLSKLLNRPANEKPFLLLPVGYAASSCLVPKITKKSLTEISTWYL